MGLQSGQRSLDADSTMAHERSPYPRPMIDGQMRETKTKANLKNAIKVEVSSRYYDNYVDTSFLDGCVVLWVVPARHLTPCKTIWTDYAVAYMGA